MMDSDYIEMGPKILIVDDNPSNVLLLQRMLRINNYTNIITTTDSRDVISLYLTNNPDLILLDLKMPYLDGFQVLEQLNQIKEDDFLPVIMVTAQNDKENRIKAFELGAKEFIGKPFDQSEVIMRIKNMLEIRLLHNKVREQNRRLEGKVIERTKELQDMQLELIQRLLRAAEFRDNATGNHITRIGLYAHELGVLLGLSKKHCEQLLHSSMMHDIGKIGIPDRILLKPAKLTPEEWEIMKLHTVKGSQILSGSSSEIIQMAEKIALTHHEKWDGTGYPHRLKGEEIPVESRITAICDVFDALLSVRPYKNMWELPDTIEEIRKSSGTHFDPLIANVFLDNLPIFIKIRSDLME